MRYTFALLAGAAGLLPSYSAAKSTDESPSPKVIALDLFRQVPLQRFSKLARRRTSPIKVLLDNIQTSYYSANITLGNPPQHFTILLDTGSSDLWVFGLQDNIIGPSYCDSNGCYNANSSNTYHYMNSLFSITYGDGTSALGDYATDVLQLGNVTIPRMEFGIGYKSTSDQAVMGIGYENNEMLFKSKEIYSNFPQQLVDLGYIGINAYSLWLDDLDAPTGSILFGGINTKAYCGELRTLPILPAEGTKDFYNSFTVDLVGMSLCNKTSRLNSVTTIFDHNSSSVPVLLDTGTTLTYLPNHLVLSLYSFLNVTYDSNQKLAFVDCGMAKSNSSINFTFSPMLTITVPLRELVFLYSYEYVGSVFTYTCLFGIQPSQGYISVLGDTFLRSAYVVYDLQNNEISMAQALFDDRDETHIIEIPSGGVTVIDQN